MNQAQRDIASELALKVHAKCKVCGKEYIMGDVSFIFLERSTKKDYKMASATIAKALYDMGWRYGTRRDGMNIVALFCGECFDKCGTEISG
jgi:hypothetical protein